MQKTSAASDVAAVVAAACVSVPGSSAGQCPADGDVAAAGKRGLQDYPEDQAAAAGVPAADDAPAAAVAVAAVAVVAADAVGGASAERGAAVAAGYAFAAASDRAYNVLRKNNSGVGVINSSRAVGFTKEEDITPGAKRFTVVRNGMHGNHYFDLGRGLFSATQA